MLPDVLVDLCFANTLGGIRRDHGFQMLDAGDDEVREFGQEESQDDDEADAEDLALDQLRAARRRRGQRPALITPLTPDHDDDERVEDEKRNEGRHEGHGVIGQGLVKRHVKGIVSTPRSVRVTRRITTPTIVVKGQGNVLEDARRMENQAQHRNAQAHQQRPRHA